MISNSYVEDSLDVEEDIDDISNTDEEATRMIQPLTIMQPKEGRFKGLPSSGRPSNTNTSCNVMVASPHVK